MKRVSAAIAAVIGIVSLPLHAQTFDRHREIEKASKQTLPAAAKQIEDNTDVKLTLTVDNESFGNDAHAWSNLYIIANRVVGALSEVGRDQMGKDAIEKSVKKIVIVKFNPTGEDDMVELKGQTVFVRTSASDKAMTVLQNVIVAALEKALPTGHPPPTP